jgi:hypothetical protein
MNSNNRKLGKRLLAVALCGAALWTGAAAADGYRDHGAKVERYWDRKGDRIERRLDHRADHLRDQGRYAEARRMERKGDRIDRRLDRKGERLARQYGHHGYKHGHHGHKHGHHGYKQGHRHDHRDYRPVYVYPAVPHYYSHEPGVTVAIDLGRWIFRP